MSSFINFDNANSLMNSDIAFSNKVSGLKPSAIREIFKSLSDPEMISFAAGNPSPLSFPVEQMKEIANDIFTNRPTAALQYSITEGYPKLREQVEERLKTKFNINMDGMTTIITTGGQQGIDLTAKVLCNEGDIIITENPSFIGALNAFRAYNADIRGVELEDDGMNLEQLEKILSENKNVKMIYTIPTFHNPGGITASLEKRKAVIALAEKYGVIILEDNPYGELRFSGEDVPTMKSLDKNGVVVYCSSFSKVLSAGMRVGFLCGRSDIIQKVVVAKQVNDVHTNIFFQLLASDFISKYGLDDHIKGIRKLYFDKCSLMLSKMDECFPKHIKYTRPDGGLFIWVTMPDKYDADLFAKEGVKEKVAVVSGTAFTPIQGEHSSSFRMNYSTPSDEQIILGVERLGKLLERYN